MLLKNKICYCLYFTNDLNSECKINVDEYNLVFNTEKEKGDPSFYTEK